MKHLSLRIVVTFVTFFFCGQVKASNGTADEALKVKVPLSFHWLTCSQTHCARHLSPIPSYQMKLSFKRDDYRVYVGTQTAAIYLDSGEKVVLVSELTQVQQTGKPSRQTLKMKMYYHMEAEPMTWQWQTDFQEFQELSKQSMNWLSPIALDDKLYFPQATIDPRLN